MKSLARRHRPDPGRVLQAGLVGASVAGIGGCELTDVVVAEPEALVVAEVLVQVRPDDASGGPFVIALLHGTAGDGTVPGAEIVIEGDAGPVPLAPSSLSDCVASAPPERGASCYRAALEDELGLRPGERLSLEIDLPGGRRLTGETTVPGSFRFTQFPDGTGGPRLCALEADTAFVVRWTGSQGAWAYVSETDLRGLLEPMAERGIVLDEDDLYLTGLSVSAADTTIDFPTEFGLFERFGPDADLLAALQRGLPPNVTARVAVAAVDRNFVNWARGGSFNPSGAVRVPSLSGDGTGFFGAAVVRELTVLVQPHESGAPPPCR